NQDKQAISEIRIQVSLPHPDMNILLSQLSQNKADLSAFRSQRLQDIKYINEYQQIINENQKMINKLKSQISNLLFENQVLREK
ncbi:1199_t:CDS:1, partial [Funneliformis caledonium]